MAYLVDYLSWQKIYEQSGSVIPLDFMVYASTDITKVSDSRLNEEHGYPMPKENTKDSSSIYELSLREALYGYFNKARIVGKTNGIKDSITFEGSDISENGTIELSWNTKSINNKIRVSGNGALVLTRMHDAASGQEVKREQTGSLILQLGLPVLKTDDNRYAKFFSIAKSGLEITDVIAKINILTQTALRAICDDETKATLTTIATEDWNEQTYSNTAPFSVKYTAAGKVKKAYPARKVNSALSTYLGKYNKEKLISKSGSPSPELRTVAKLVKQSYIDPGLSNLSAYLLPFFSKEFSELPKNVITRLIAKAQSNIDEAKRLYTSNRTAYVMLNSFKTATVVDSKPDTTKVQKDVTTFAPGK